MSTQIRTFGLALRCPVKINCIHGFFIFEESRAGELSDWVSLFEIPLARRGSIFTFEPLALAPDFSIKGAPILDATAVKSFAGDPGEVFRENGLIYNFQTQKLMPIETVTQTITIVQGQNYFLSSGLIIPGSLTDEGDRVTDYAAHFSTDTMKFRFSEVIRG